MAWSMPAPPDQLVNLLRRQSPMAPAGAVPPPVAPAPGVMSYGPQPTPETIASNRAIEGQPAPMAQPQATAPPPPSDDPSLAPVKAPDLSAYAGPMMDWQKQQADLTARRKAVPDIDPNAVKPKLWERIVGGLLGATQLKNPENAGAVAGEVVNRRLNTAERNRAIALQPINEQQEALDKQLPGVSALSRTGYENAELGLKTAGENRERAIGKGNLNYKSDWNDIRQQRTDDQQKAAADRIEQQKSALEERERNDRERNALTDRLRTVEENRPTAGDKPATKGQFAGVEVKKQQALSKAHSDYQKSVSGLAPDDADGRKQASDELQSAQQQAQDAYEQEIIALGGTAEHMNLADQNKPKAKTTPAVAAPATEKKPVDSLGGHKVGDTVTLKGGQKVKIKQLYADGSFDHEPVSK